MTHLMNFRASPVNLGALMKVASPPSRKSPIARHVQTKTAFALPLARRRA